MIDKLRKFAMVCNFAGLRNVVGSIIYGRSMVKRPMISSSIWLGRYFHSLSDKISIIKDNILFRFCVPSMAPTLVSAFL